MPAGCAGDQRARYRVNPIPPGDLLENSLPAPAMGPPVPVGGRPPRKLPGEVMDNNGAVGPVTEVRTGREFS